MNIIHRKFSACNINVHIKKRVKSKYVPEIILCLRPALTVESVCFAPPDSISTSLSAEVLKCDVRMFTLNLTSSNSLSGDISVT